MVHTQSGRCIPPTCVYMLSSPQRAELRYIFMTLHTRRHNMAALIIQLTSPLCDTSWNRAPVVRQNRAYRFKQKSSVSEAAALKKRHHRHQQVCQWATICFPEAMAFNVWRTGVRFCDNRQEEVEETEPPLSLYLPCFPFFSKVVFSALTSWELICHTRSIR